MDDQAPESVAQTVEAAAKARPSRRPPGRVAPVAIAQSGPQAGLGGPPPRQMVPEKG